MTRKVAFNFCRLDLKRRAPKTSRMDSRAENFYAVWRQQCRALALHDGDSAPPEKLLQTVWLHQRLKRDALKTADGTPLRVLHPGFISAEGGPDFRGAVLRLGDEPPVSGDVEIDVQPAGWHAHGHDRNPNFKNVILHVVWEGGSALAPSPRPSGERGNAAARFATLSLKPFLDAPLAELALALENESGLPASLRGKCSAPLRELSGSQLSELLHAAAKVRFENKAMAMLARARQSGWEPALWENLFRALGYKHNVWPMQNLAETKSRWFDGRDSALRCPDAAARRPYQSCFEIQARLLGVGGLLPAELTRSQKSSDTFLRRAWDCWWRDRDGLADCALPRAVWKFHGLRPANHPQRRLALAAHWLASGDLPGKIEEWIKADISGGASVPASRFVKTPAPPKVTPRLLDSLHNLFQVERDDYWSWHWTFNSARMARPQPLLGAARVTDLAVNVVLPWLWIRAKEGGNGRILAEVERRYFAWPAAEDNSVLKLARQRLLGTSKPGLLQGAAEQQGLLQIVRDFCEHSNAICADCRFPELVRCLKAKVQS
jgi:hypothetical protein